MSQLLDFQQIRPVRPICGKRHPAGVPNAPHGSQADASEQFRDFEFETSMTSSSFKLVDSDARVVDDLTRSV